MFQSNFFQFITFMAVAIVADCGQANSQTVAKITDISPTRSNHKGDQFFPKGDPAAASGGRINALALDPRNNNIVYAASEWGGLWKSTDGGLNWSHLTGHLPQATWDIEVDPANSTRIYATSLFDGHVQSRAGISISTDSGKTWSQSETARPNEDDCPMGDPSRMHAFGIAIDAERPSHIAIGTDCGLALSKDSGVTWHHIIPGNMVPDLEIDPPQELVDKVGQEEIGDYEPGGNIHDAIVHHGGILDVCGPMGHFRSKDWGTSWTTAKKGQGRLPDAEGCSLAASPYEGDVLFATAGTLLMDSVDGGNSWRNNYGNPVAQGRVPFVATNRAGPGKFDLWFADVELHRRPCVTPPAGQLGSAKRCAGDPLAWADGKEGEGGWEGGFARNRGAHPDAGDLVFSTAAGGSVACPSLFASDGGVYLNTRKKSPDCNTPAWRQPDTTPRALWNFELVGTKDPKTGKVAIYFGAQDNGTFGTLDIDEAGASSNWNNQFCCDGPFMAASAKRVLSIICCAQTLLLSEPGLKGSPKVVAGPDGALRAFDQLDSLAEYAPDSYVLLTDSSVHLTSNILATPPDWVELSARQASPVPYDPCGVQVGFHGTKPVFYVLGRDPLIEYRGACSGEESRLLWRYEGIGPGGTWKQLKLPNDGNVTIYSVDKNDADRVIAADVNEAMWITTNAGASWVRLPQLEQMMTGNGKIHFSVYAGPSGPLAGKTTFDAYRQPTLLAIDPENPSVIVAGAADAGLSISIDGGTNWKLLTDPFTPHTSKTPHIPRPRYVYFDNRPDNKLRLFIGSQGRGAWQIDLKGVRPPERSTLASNDLFDSGSARLKTTAGRLLRPLAQKLAIQTEAIIYVDGHADSRGSDAANQKLAEQRAAAVKTWLTTSGGLRPVGVKARGFGESRPVATNVTAEGQAKNRRIEVTVVTSPASH